MGTLTELKAALDAMEKFKAGQKMSKAENIAAGLYHPVGEGIKLSRPPEMMTRTVISDPNVTLAERKIITPEELYRQKAALVPLIGDRADTGKILTQIDNQELGKQIKLTGGPNYMAANLHEDPTKSAAWESGQSRVTTINNQVKRAAEAGNPVYGIYSAGSPVQGDFNTMMSQALYNQIDPSALTKKGVMDFDKTIAQTYPEWLGLYHPEAESQLLDKSNGVLRTAFTKEMAKERFQSQGFPDVPATRKAITQPELFNEPLGTTGFALAKMDPTGRIIEQPKAPSGYPVSMAGEYAGGLDQMQPFNEMFSTFTQARRNLGKPEASDYRSYELGHPIQYADQEWLDNLMQAREARDKLISGEKEGGEITTDKDRYPTHEEAVAAFNAAYPTPDYSKPTERGPISQAAHDLMVQFHLLPDSTPGTISPESQRASVYGAGQIGHARGGRIHLSLLNPHLKEHVKRFADGGSSVQDQRDAVNVQALSKINQFKDTVGNVIKNEIDTLSTPEGRKDVLTRIGTNIASGAPDLVNLAQSYIPGLNKSESVFGGDKVAAYPLTGSEDLNQGLQKSGLLGQNTAPVTELVGSMFGPSALGKVAKLTKGLPIGASIKPIGTTVNLPIADIVHGESAMPGGKLTWPGASDKIREYANRPTPFPPIEVMSGEGNEPWTIYDGSHRLEAAKLRGDTTIPATISPYDTEGLEKVKNMQPASPKNENLSKLMNLRDDIAKQVAAREALEKEYYQSIKDTPFRQQPSFPDWRKANNKRTGGALTR